MGLDVSSFSKLKPAPDAERDEDGDLADYENHTQFYDNPDFPGRIEGVVAEQAYTIEGECDHLSMGYGRYNGWRDELAKLAGYPLESYQNYGARAESHCVACWNGAAGPFAEQINFSDCEGTIGPVVSAKLAKDYAEFADKAEQVGGAFWDYYQKWRRAFELGADSGAVNFH